MTPPQAFTVGLAIGTFCVLAAILAIVITAG